VVARECVKKALGSEGFVGPWGQPIFYDWASKCAGPPWGGFKAGISPGERGLLVSKGCFMQRFSWVAGRASA
jgi:hypothetical protein